MNIWLLSALFVRCYYVAGEAQYECGPHGRFEYCIDGIPGCVIGCHCHPGYYFDTESKICEPNIKLSQDYRRHYLSEPTRVQVQTLKQPVRSEFTSTNNPVDDKIDEITKDAGDLGDWLYNQFFKTIENQVINNTNENEKELTRRSGSVSIKKKPKKKGRKYLRKSDRKKKNKKNGLKNKLLRITEDDSLFDSSSGSSSDETSSSSGDSDSGTSSDNDHGHKKILIYNKKPKPPLPSFIFLPNMDTPFYPPIGLPPPPVLPMYPMIPVPPMGQMFRYTQGTTPSGDSGTTNSKKNSASSTSNSSATSTTTISTTIETTTETTTRKEKDTSPGEKSGRSRNKNEKQSKGRSNSGRQNKLLRKIKENLKKRNKIAPIDHISNLQNEDDPFVDSNYLQNSPIFYKKQTNNFEDDAPMEDVDFKYITELIHRVNNTKKASELPSNDVFIGIPRPTSRRNYDHNLDIIPQSKIPTITDHKLMRKTQDLNDSYYTNLGRQIASMIRKIDSQGQRQLNIEIERSKPSTAHSQTFFDENIYASRSYWDRFIRSPEKRYYPMILRKTGGYYKNINENLVNIENKVKLAVNTILPLSLPELENIINEIKYVNNQTEDHQSTEQNQMVADTQFRYNLFHKSRNTPIRSTNNIVNVSKTVGKMEYDKNYNELFHDLLKIAPLSDGIGNKTNISRRIITTPSKRSFDDSAFKIPLLSHLQILKTGHNYLPLKRTTKIPSYVPIHENSVRFNHKNLNYIGNVNQYVYQKSPYSIHFPDNRKTSSQPKIKSIKPSYFHHELHHFDYFDNN